ncbi:hypothetical protein TSOC_013398, partial [Tetrabaena socialis]
VTGAPEKHCRDAQRAAQPQVRRGGVPQHGGRRLLLGRGHAAAPPAPGQLHVPLRPRAGALQQLQPPRRDGGRSGWGRQLGQAREAGAADAHGLEKGMTRACGAQHVAGPIWSTAGHSLEYGRAQSGVRQRRRSEQPEVRLARSDAGHCVRRVAGIGRWAVAQGRQPARSPTQPGLLACTASWRVGALPAEEADQAPNRPALGPRVRHSAAKRRLGVRA